MAARTYKTPREVPYFWPKGRENGHKAEHGGEILKIAPKEDYLIMTQVPWENGENIHVQDRPKTNIARSLKTKLQHKSIPTSQT